MEHTRKLRRWGGFLLLLVLLVTFLIWNLLAGSVRLPASEIWAILHGGGDLTQRRILLKIRLTRLLAAMILGGALSVSGFLLQTFFHNPIAGPFVLGISSGAKFTVAVTMILLLSRGVTSSSAALIAAAFVGAMLIAQAAHFVVVHRHRVLGAVLGGFWIALGLADGCFSPLGAELGAELAVHGWLLVPLAMVLGWFIISAEPAVGVLEKQIESVSAGAIPGKVIQRSLSVAIALAMGLSMLRVLTGISILWFLVPGYGIALALSFFVPDIYTAIAFDSGGVASGPMTATFMLQFVMGASSALGGNILRDAFGVVALVAMMPLLSIQAVGFLYERRAKRTAAAPEQYGDFDIVELWEDAA